MQDTELSELVRRARKGSSDAYEALVRRYSAALFGYFVRSVGNRTDAEDLLGEVFLRLVRGLGRYRERERFEVWLFRLAHNLLVDHWRRRRPTAVSDYAPDSHRGGQADPVETLASREADPAARVESAEEQDRLQRALAALPADQREMVLLRYFGGISYKEIASLTDRPIGTVLARVHRGLARLRDLLSQENDDGRS